MPQLKDVLEDGFVNHLAVLNAMREQRHIHERISGRRLGLGATVARTPTTSLTTLPTFRFPCLVHGVFSGTTPVGLMWAATAVGADLAVAITHNISGDGAT